MGAERDEYVAQSGEVARRLGVIDPPTTEAGLAEALASYRPELRGTPEAREAVSLPAAASRRCRCWRRAPYGVLVAAGVGLMPRWTRRPLRLPWLPVSERTVVRALGGLATGTIRWAMTHALSQRHAVLSRASGRPGRRDRRSPPLADHHVGVAPEGAHRGDQPVVVEGHRVERRQGVGLLPGPGGDLEVERRLAAGDPGCDRAGSWCRAAPGWRRTRGSRRGR